MHHDRTACRQFAHCNDIIGRVMNLKHQSEIDLLVALKLAYYSSSESRKLGEVSYSPTCMSVVGTAIVQQAQQSERRMGKDDESTGEGASSELQVSPVTKY